MGKYRFVFLANPDDERPLAAFELFAASPEAAHRLAAECLDKSPASLVEVWSEGRCVLHLSKVHAAA